MNLRTALFLMCSLTTASVFAQKKATPSKENSVILFTVNKKPVTVEEFMYLYKKNHQNPAEDFTKEKIEEYLQLYINFKLKVEEARNRGMDTTIAFKKEFNQYKEELRKPYLPGNGMADSLTKMTYQRMKEEVKAAHILVSVKPDADPQDTLVAYKHIVDLRNRVVAGEDFAELASQYSEDPSAKMNHGDLGYFTALQMVYPFENAAYSTRVGEVSQPIRTRFGYHILKVSDRRPAEGEIEVAHIMIRTGEEKDTQQARDQIFTIFEQLEAGLKWDDLCRQYSEDPGTRENGGKLRPFRAGMMSNVPEFERVAFELERAGQYSDPFQTQFGWHIVKLERKIPLGSYEEMAPSLKNRISRDERTQISKQALQTKLRKDFGLEENQAIKNKLLSLPDSALRKGAWRKSIDPKMQNAVLFKLSNGKSFSVGQFLTNYDKNPSSGQAGLLFQYNQYIDESILQSQEESVARTHPEFRFLLNEYYEGILLFEIMEKEVWNKASEDSVGQHHFYMENAARYSGGERAKATIYTVSDSTVVSPLRSLIATANQAQIQEYVVTNKIKTESGYFTRDDKAILKKVPWENGVHVKENNGIHYLVWLKEVLPAGRMTFEEARPSLIADFQNHLEQKWLVSLKKKYPVKINSKGRSFMFNQLEKSRS